MIPLQRHQRLKKWVGPKAKATQNFGGKRWVTVIREEIPVKVRMKVSEFSRGLTVVSLVPKDKWVLCCCTGDPERGELVSRVVFLKFRGKSRIQGCG